MNKANENILDAEGDGGAVAIARLFKRREGVSKNAAPEFAARTMAEWNEPEGNEYWEYVQDLYTHPARSGVVSDEDVDAIGFALIKAGWRPPLGKGETSMRAALETFMENRK